MSSDGSETTEAKYETSVKQATEPPIGAVMGSNDPDAGEGDE